MRYLPLLLLFLLLSCDISRSISSPKDPKGCSEIFFDLVWANSLDEWLIDYDDFLQKMELFKTTPGDPRQLIEANNKLMLFYKNIFKRSSIQTEIVKTQYIHKGVTIDFDRLVLIPNKDNHALVDRVTEGLGVGHIYLEMIRNELRGNGGFYRAKDNIISLDLMEIFGVLRKSELPESLKHEFSHAQFESLRKKGYRSIYSNEFFSSKTKKLNEDTYIDYMSAEELYNYLGGPYWQLKPKKIYLHNPDLILKDLKIISTNLNAAERYPIKVGYLTTDFLESIAKLKKEPLGLASVKVEVEKNYITIFDKEYRYLKSFIDDEKKPLSDRYLKELEEYIKYDDVYDSTEKFVDKIKNPQITLGFKGTWDSFKNIVKDNMKKEEAGKELKLALTALLNEVAKEQRMLNRVANEIKPQVKKCQQMVQEILDNPKPDEVWTKFDLIRKELRALANMPREHFKGFAGELSLNQDIAVEAQRNSLISKIVSAMRNLFSQKGIRESI